MKTDGVNHLNTGLMLLSLAAAFVLPFELFLFAYAVIGPLHYLTEISWLSDRGFFTKKKYDWILLATLCLLVLLGQQAILGNWHVPLFRTLNPELVLGALGLALILATVKGSVERALALLALIAVVVSFHGMPSRVLIFGLYVPTIVHVVLFTGAFILFGALKAKSISGYLSFAVFVACLACALAVAPATQAVASKLVLQSYQSFAAVNVSLARNLGFASAFEPAPAPDFAFFPFGSYTDIFNSPAGVRVMRFIAFAYTYHYLNWFSKTSIIGWHKVPKARIAVVVAIWIASLALFRIDYLTGVKWVYLLSFLHVMFEFPLNHLSFIGIGKEIAARLRSPVNSSGARG